jgi:hypothetical protein
MVRDYKPDPNEATAMLPGDLVQFELFQFKQLMVQKPMNTNRFYVWIDVVQGEDDQSYVKKDGVLEFKAKSLLRWLTAEEKAKLDGLQAEITALTKAMPPEYPYLMGLKDDSNAKNIKLNIRGNAHALGEEVPRGLPAILGKTDGDPLPFTRGADDWNWRSNRAASLAARVMVNRIWQHHFGRGIVDTPSNFGVMGERPTHPELLDYLAARFIESGWSMKAMHREIMNSAAYQLAYQRGCEFRGRSRKPAGVAREFPAARNRSASRFRVVRVRPSWTNGSADRHRNWSVQPVRSGPFTAALPGRHPAYSPFLTIRIRTLRRKRERSRTFRCKAVLHEQRSDPA